MIIKPILYSYPDLDLIEDKNSFFESIKEEYPKIKDTNIIKTAKKPAIFVYIIRTKTRFYHGILAGVDIDEYLNGKILKHENTLLAQEKKIASLTIQRSAIIKPVLLAYKNNQKINELIAKAFLGNKPKLKIKFEKDNQLHEIYSIDTVTDIKAFQREFKNKVNKSYIADGHHRMSTIKMLIDERPELKNKGLSTILCALFTFSELDIYPYNRLVHILDLIDIEVVLKQLEPFAEIVQLKTIRVPLKKGEIIMHSHDSIYSIVWRKEIIKNRKNNYPVQFDIDLFNDIVLNEIFNIQDLRSNPRIHYVEAPKGNKLLLKAIQENKELLGFSFFPIKKSHFIKIANENLILPPKSTWFEPRIRNGLIIQKIFE
ncbi:MAG: DUF1015 family protein [Saprospiraceae bacterium]